MKFGTLCPNFSELNFHSWCLKASGEHVYFITPHSELKLDRECCKKAFEKASGDGLFLRAIFHI